MKSKFREACLMISEGWFDDLAWIMKNLSGIAVIIVVSLLLWLMGSLSIKEANIRRENRATRTRIAEHVGELIGTKKMREEAVKAGVGRWVVTNETTGATGFIWKEMK